MVCQSCQANPATIHFTEIKEDERVELHVCEECATQQGLTNETSIPSMLAGMVAAAARGASVESLQCPHCGISFRDFRRKGRLGCPKDYEVFEQAMIPLLEKMHDGAQRHTGRLPRGRHEVETTVTDRLLQLRRDLQRAVTEERYEDAAALRDEIASVEKAASEEGLVGEA